MGAAGARRGGDARRARANSPSDGVSSRLAELTEPAGTDWALGTQARSRALLSDGESAEDLYQEAVERFGRTRLRPELARAHLLYGEWLRREGRRVDAREQLRTAHDMLAGIGMDAFAERARRELVATGEKATQTKRGDQDDLTAQEAQIAQLAREGYSNQEIGAPAVPEPRAPSSGTCARCSASSPSALADNSTPP